MNIKNLFKKDYIVGLDIGSASIKIAQFKDAEGSSILVRGELQEIAVSAAEGIKEKEIVSAMRYLLRGIDTKRSRVIAVINCPQTTVKKIVAPYIPISELREGIMLESKNYFPFLIDNSILDFEVLGDFVEKGLRKYEILVGTCPVQTSNFYVSLLEKAGVKPAAFISSSYALQKLASKISGKSPEARCFIDIGAVHTELAICKDGALVFTRKIPVSGSDFTRAMTGLLVSDKGTVQLSVEEAEKIKRDIGLPSDDDKRAISDKLSASQVLAMLRPPAENLVNEISRCFDYYREEAAGGSVNSVTIFGGGASLTGLPKFMSDALGVTVKIGDPIEGLTLGRDAVRSGGRITHCLDLAIGASMSGLKNINLLPEHIKNETKTAIKRGTMKAVVTAVVIITALFFVGMKINLGNFDKRIAAAKLELASLQPEMKSAEARRLAEMVLENEPYWESIFKELGSLIPNDITIRSFKMDNGSILMKGVVTSPDGQQILSDFISTLEKGLFSDVKLIESKNLPEEGSGIEFEIGCWIDYER